MREVVVVGELGGEAFHELGDMQDIDSYSSVEGNTDSIVIVILMVPNFGGT